MLDKAGTVTFCCMLEDQGVASVEGQNLYDTLYDTISFFFFQMSVCLVEIAQQLKAFLQVYVHTGQGGRVCVRENECVLACFPAKFS